jgi:hypothetical protein
MTLENLVRIGKLKPHQATSEEIARLLVAAQRNIRDARVRGVSTETRFDAAYKAGFQCGLVALLARGYRPSTSEPGHHATVIQSLATTIDIASDQLIVLDKLRRLRNQSDYTGEDISEAETATCLRAVESLQALLMEWLRAHRPDLLSDH